MEAGEPDEERPGVEVDLGIEDQEEAVEAVVEVAALGLEEVVVEVGEETRTSPVRQVLEGEDNMLSRFRSSGVGIKEGGGSCCNSQEKI